VGSKMTNRKLVTAIVPICEPVSELRNLLHWIDDLSGENLALVLVVDDKYPQSVSLLREVAILKPWIWLEVVSLSNPGSAREYGRKFVKTEFVCFWDADDTPNVRQIMRAIDGIEPDIDLLIGGFKKVQFENSDIGTANQRPKSLAEIFATPGLWRMIFRTSSIAHIKFPELSMAEDQIFFAELRPWTLKYSLIEEILYEYSIGRKSQLTNNSSALEDLSSSIEILCTFLKKESTNIGEYYLGILLVSQIISLLKRKKFILVSKCHFKIFKLLIWKPRLNFSLMRSFLSICRIKIVKND